MKVKVIKKNEKYLKRKMKNTVIRIKNSTSMLDRDENKPIKITHNSSKRNEEVENVRD